MFFGRFTARHVGYEYDGRFISFTKQPAATLLGAFRVGSTIAVWRVQEVVARHHRRRAKAQLFGRADVCHRRVDVRLRAAILSAERARLDQHARHHVLRARDTRELRRLGAVVLWSAHSRAAARLLIFFSGDGLEVHAIPFAPPRDHRLDDQAFFLTA